MQNYILKYKQCKQTSLDKLIQLGLLNDLDLDLLHWYKQKCAFDECMLKTN